VAVPVEISAGTPAGVEAGAPLEIAVTEAAEAPEPEAPRLFPRLRPVEERGVEFPEEPGAAPEISEPPLTSPPSGVAAGPALASAEERQATSWPAAEKPAAGKEILAQGRPIRLEFKDTHPPASPPVRSSGPWGIFSIIAGIAILAVAFAWFVFLRGSPAPAGLSPAAQGEAEAVPPEQEAPPEAAPPEAEAGTASGETPPPAGTTADQIAPETGDPAPEAVEKGSPDPVENTSTALPGPVSPVTSGVESGAGRADGETEPPPASVPQEASSPGPAAKQVASAPPFAATGRFFEARAQLDAGDALAAASSWLEMVREETKNGFTVQIAIACQEESVKKAARHTRGSSDFFTVPFLLQGRSCYRFCWGAYSTEEEAQAGKSAVPAFFLSEGGKPVVVRLSKLTPPEKR
jgi:hypothetical protein